MLKDLVIVAPRVELCLEVAVCILLILERAGDLLKLVGELAVCRVLTLELGLKVCLDGRKLRSNEAAQLSLGVHRMCDQL